jgi:hypothetical protein
VVFREHGLVVGGGDAPEPASLLSTHYNYLPDLGKCG